MNAKLQESLSALMDNEADELELRRILKEVPQDSDMQDYWRRWHLISDCLRGEVHTRPATNLLGGIHAALDAEPPPVRHSSSQSIPTPLRYLGQAAIAASVAVGVFMLMPDQWGASEGAADAMAESGLQAATTGPFSTTELARAASFSDASLDQDARNRLQEAVYREFGEGTQLPAATQNRQPLEMPVNYTPFDN